MKKSSALILSMLLILLAGCGASSTGSAPASGAAPAQSGPPASAAAPSAESEAAEPPAVLIYADESAEATTRAQAVKEYARMVSEKSSGGITIETYFAGTLGTARESLEAMQVGGTVDMTITIEPLSYWLEDVNVLSVPYLFDSEDHVDAFIKSDVGKDFIQTMLDKGSVRALTYMPTDARVITSNKPIYGLNELKGLVIRVPETSTGPLAFEAMGCKVTTMPFSELFSALQQGVVEAQENPLVFMVTQSLYDVQSHASLTNHSITVPFLFVSEASYQKLPPHQQQILYDCAEEARLFEKEIRAELLASAVDTLKEKGITIVEEPDREEIAAAVSTAYAKYDPIIQEWIGRIQSVPH